MHEARQLRPELRDRIERLLGARVRESRPAPGGYSAAQRWVVELDGRSSAFVKMGVPPVANENLRHETLVYQRLQLACMPRVIAWEDDALHPLLVLEDLSGFDWPPPWTDRSIGAALLTIQSIHASTGRLDAYEERHGLEKTGWWSSIARNPEPFLRLGLRTKEWMGTVLPSLIHASETVSPAGESVCHFDLRSDNICLSARRGVVIDWSLACLGNPRIDLGLFLPGIADEGGPAPEEILPSAPDVAAWVSGFFAVHASKDFIPTAPQVRVMQRKHLIRSLEWAEREIES